MRLRSILIGILLGGVLVSWWAVRQETARHHGPAFSTDDFSPLWTFAASGPITGALALGEDGTLYAASEDGFVYAVDPSGALQWKFEAGPLAAAPVLGADGSIYVSNMDEQVFALNRTGTQQWSAGGGPYADKGTLWRAGATDGNFFYTPWRGSLRALRVTTGRIEWSTGMGFEKEGSVSVLPNGLLVYPEVGRLTAADSFGKTIWQYPAMNPPLTVEILQQRGGHPPSGNFWLDSAIAVGLDSTMYAAAGGAHDMAFSPSGTVKWSFPLKSTTPNRAAPVIAADGTVYFGCGEGSLYALDSDGAMKWELNVNGPIDATPVLAADGTLLIFAAGELVSVSPEGKILSKLPFPEDGKSAPTLAPNGNFYVGTRGGKIAAFATKHGPLMNSPWPKFQRDLANSGHAPPF